MSDHSLFVIRYVTFFSTKYWKRLHVTGAHETVKSTLSIMDNIFAQVIEYISYWLSISVVLTLKEILGCNMFVSGCNKERLNGALKVMDSVIFSSFSKFELYHSSLRGIFIMSLMWSGVGGFVGKLIVFLPIACMCLIWLKMYLFYCRFFFKMLLSLWDVITLTLLYFPYLDILESFSWSSFYVSVGCL